MGSWRALSQSRLTWLVSVLLALLVGMTALLAFAPAAEANSLPSRPEGHYR